MTVRSPIAGEPRLTPEPPEEDARTEPRRLLTIVLIALVVIGAIVVASVLLIGRAGDEPAPVAPPSDDATEDPVEEPATPATPAPEVPYDSEPPANWDVTGVAAGDMLNVRTAPGAHNPVTATLAHDTTELESTGRIATVDGVLWREIKVPGATTGWVNARFLTETRPPQLPAAVSAMVARIQEAARAEDWDRLAELALAGDMPFTASFGEDFTTAGELAGFWRDEAAAQPLADILLGLLGLPDWYVTTGADAAGNAMDIHVSPRFMHEPNDPNREALEAAIGVDRVAASIADGQYLGWRVGITAEGDWLHFVSGD